MTLSAEKLTFRKKSLKQLICTTGEQLLNQHLGVMTDEPRSEKGSILSVMA